MKSALWALSGITLLSSAAAQVPAAKALPPLVIPDELIAPVPLEQTAHAADWALKFGRGATTAEQRERYNQDLANWIVARAKLAAEKYQLLTGQKVELALGDIKRLGKQTVEIEAAVAAILEKQKKEEAAARAKAAVEAFVRQADEADAAAAAMRQQQALESIRLKQLDLEQQLQRLRR